MRSIHKIILLLSLVASFTNAANDVIVDKLKLFVDGQEFFIKAMCYNPVPLGIQHMDSDGNGGGGYCSPKMTAHGEWKSACYDSDYFDGSSDDPQRVPAAPSSWFQAVWERDFPEIHAVGANTLRIYNSNPTTRQASEDPANGFTKPYGKDHVPFFDMAASYGFKIIFPLFGDYSFLVNTPTDQFKQYLEWQINEIGNHPALMMFTLGNELDLNGNQQLIQIVNTYMAYAREYMTTKWGRKIPVTTALVDLPNSYSSLMRDLDVDVFTTNAGYRGFDFSDLWSSQANGLFQLSCTYNKPVFIGEIGWMSMNGDVNAQYPNWVNRIWKDLVNHIPAGCIGGAFFEYSNEIYSKSDPLQQHMGIVSFEVAGDSDQPNVFKVDKATHMPYIYDALASGTHEGVAYNMNADPFDLIGRSAYTLSSAPEICSGSYTTPTPRTTPSGECSISGSCTGSSTASPSVSTTASPTSSSVTTANPTSSSSTSAPSPSSSTTPSSSSSTPTPSSSDDHTSTSGAVDPTVPLSDSDHPLEPANFGLSLKSMCLGAPAMIMLALVVLLVL